MYFYLIILGTFAMTIIVQLEQLIMVKSAQTY